MKVQSPNTFSYILSIWPRRDVVDSLYLTAIDLNDGNVCSPAVRLLVAVLRGSVGMSLYRLAASLFYFFYAPLVTTRFIVCVACLFP